VNASLAGTISDTDSIEQVYGSVEAFCQDYGRPADFAGYCYQGHPFDLRDVVRQDVVESDLAPICMDRVAAVDMEDYRILNLIPYRVRGLERYVIMSSQNGVVYVCFPI
jgi:hypothetical protein